MAVKKRKKATRPSADAISFEDAFQQLEAIVRELEDGRVGLADALERYEQGVKLLKDCYRQLEKAEHRIELLSGVDADGNPLVADFDEDAGDSLEEKAATRAQRRSAASPKRKRRPVTDDEADGLF